RKRGRGRPVRQWAVQMPRRCHPDALAQLPLPELFALLGHEDADIAALAAEGLRNASGLGTLPGEQWLGLLEAPNPQTLDILCELMVRHLHPNAVSFAQALKLAC